MFSRLTKDSLILEFVPTDDPMFRQLTKFRTVDFSHVTLAACIEVFSRDFTIEASNPLPDVGRQLLLLRKIRV